MHMRIAVIPSEPSTDPSDNIDRQCWDWSIRPLIIFAKFIGVDLSPTTSANENCKTWKILCFTWLLINIVYMFIAFQVLVSQLDEFSSYLVGKGGIVSKTFVWNVVIDSINFTFGSIMTHLILIFIVKKRWPLLSEAFRHFNFSDADLNAEIRRCSFSGLLHIGLWIGALSSSGVASPKSTISVKVQSFVSIVLQVYPVWALVMFSVASRSSSAVFKSIAMQLNGLKLERANNLIDLKSHYVLACDIVDGINDCFGWPLLVIIPYHFLAIINASFYMFGQTGETIAVSETLFFLFYPVNLFILTYAAGGIRNRSNDVLKELLRLKIDSMNLSCRKQVHEFVMLVAISSPRISALGFFNVGQKLIPQMIGTVISYFVILRQFHLSEDSKSIS